jgi:hypothetical protein
MDTYLIGFVSGMLFGLVLAYWLIPTTVGYYRSIERRYIPAARRHQAHQRAVRRRHER